MPPDITLVPVEHNPFEVWGSSAQPELVPEASIDPRLGQAILGYLPNLAKRAIDAATIDVQQRGSYGPERQGLAGPALEAAMLPMGTGAVAGLPLRAGEAALGAGPIRAYHGSPHDFDAFSLDKIGTGEGAQAYGHGLYFAEAEPTALSYKNQLSGGPLLEGGIDPFKDMPWMMRTQKDIASQQIKNALESGATGDEALMAAVQKLNDAASGIKDNFVRQHYYDGANALLTLRGKKWEVSPGRMYEVNINADPEHFLDWDKPLSEQPELAQKLGWTPEEIAAFHKSRSTDTDNLLSALQGNGSYTPATELSLNGRPPLTATGADIAKGNSVFDRGSDVGKAANLRDAGIPGIKYLDQGSRAAGEGSRNYVVFDDSLINIIRKYGMAGLSMLPPATAAYLSQKIQPVDHDPFSSGATLTPVEHDPFEQHT